MWYCGTNPEQLGDSAAHLVMLLLCRCNCVAMFELCVLRGSQRFVPFQNIVPACGSSIELDTCPESGSSAENIPFDGSAAGG